VGIFIDSAILGEVEAAKSLGWVRGVTTNPVLLAKAGGEPGQVLESLSNLDLGPLFYQLVSQDLEGMHQEVERAVKHVGQGLVLKVPPTRTGFKFVGECPEHPCCITAVFSPAQALAARESGAKFVAVYVNRAERLLGDGLKLVRNVSAVLEGSGTEIVAASIKSAEEACNANSAGAEHLTLPYEVLTSLMIHPLSEQTLREFQIHGVGILS